ncbi:hypothetical protein Emed_003959 [Eimeria media]
MKRNQFSDPVVGCLALVPYSASFPASFNTGFISFGLILKVSLQIGIIPLVAVLLADAATATALYGWQNPSHVTLFLFFLLLILLGLALDYRRDLVQLSPGFAAAAAALAAAAAAAAALAAAAAAEVNALCDAKDEPPVPMEVGGGPGIDMPGTQRRGERERPPAEVETTEPFLIFPEGKEQPPGGIRRREFRGGSDSDEDSDADSIEQDDDFALKWIDTTRVSEASSCCSCFSHYCGCSQTPPLLTVVALSAALLPKAAEPLLLVLGMLTAASLATTVDETSSLMSPYISPSFADEEELLFPVSRSGECLDTKGSSALRARDQRRPHL